MKHSFARVFASILALCLLVSLLPPLRATETVIYDAAEMPVFQRTYKEVTDRYVGYKPADSTYVPARSSSYYDRPASTVAPYDQGVLSQDTLDAMVGMMNFLRWLCGENPLQEIPTNNDKLQREALIRNFCFAHYVDDSYKPDDMDQELWNSGASMTHNILAIGYTPHGAVIGWCQEGYSLYDKEWTTFGHRSAILHPSVSAISFGYSGMVAIGRNTASQNQFDSSFTAFPPPGPVPRTLVSVSETAWNVILNPNDLTIPDAGAVLVTITDQDGNVTTRKEADDTAYAYSSSVYFVQPNSDEYYYPDGTTFTVVITGMKDVKTNQPAELHYQVEFFNSAYYEDTTVKSAEATGWKKVSIPQSFATQENLNLLATQLPSTVTVTAENSTQREIPCLTDWTLDQENHRWLCQADGSALPEYVTDPNGILNAVSVPYSFSTYLRMYAQEDAILGQPGTIVVQPYYSSAKEIVLFQIVEENGQKQLLRRYDQNSPNFKEIVTYYDYGGYQYADRHFEFAIDEWAMSDSGEWFVMQDASYNGICISETLQIAVICPHAQTEETTEPPSCLSPGRVKTVCKACGVVVSEQTVPPLGHDWGDWQTDSAPTCTEEGIEFRFCNRCGERDERSVEALGHDFGAPTQENVVEPTCTTEGGYDLVTRCRRCGGIAASKHIDVPPLGHDWDAGVVTREPTAKADGEKTFTCRRCGQTRTEGISNNPFVDVKKSKYYYKAVLWAYYHDPRITSGTDATHFSPNADCTREQVVTFLWAAMGKPDYSLTENPFKDVKRKAYYYDAVMWAVENGITKGVSDEAFGVKQNCTREQVVTFLWTAAGRPEPDATECPFRDVKRKAYYYKAVLWAVQNGVTSGLTATSFGVGKTCSRAQIVVFLNKYDAIRQ